MSNLTDKQQAFVEEYIKDFNATRAAIAAGYSKKSASEIAYDNLRKPQIQKAISEAKWERSERVMFDADEVLRAHVEIHRMDIADILDDNGAVLPLQQWPKEWRQNISSFEVQELTQDGVVIGHLKKLKWPSKLDNLKLLGQHVSVGAYSEQLRASIKHSGEINLRSDEQLRKELDELRNRLLQVDSNP
ncbi:MAG: terminase small subunit [Candidatus Thiothrix singaporensis]|uniref:Terminase small subunit n=1 Tax=Candidatus Thiothrix singaporensis TaxID=2799669 RepID=A0A7L6AY24_9GAMM|nr:MAG: terminase small subunit [Candidatus Thiothrix singaporensis]